VEHRERVRTQVDSVDKNLPPLAGIEPSVSALYSDTDTLQRHRPNGQFFSPNDREKK